MEATLKSTSVPRWYLITSSIAVLFWLVAFFWHQFLYRASDDPGFGFALFLTLVFISFVRRSYHLHLPASPALLRHAAAFSTALLLFAGWFGIGICIIRYIPA